ncbi:HAD-IA family hydrolase [Aquisalimonas sp.]|uniref:HAD-IA family hydrolase n=1 Tax=Aquisalimonas sp. TaxID=1872621 RepID=UPI0025BFDBF1|nr:HAD-IA family hydrolase [Aquisalimonas sp.]
MTAAGGAIEAVCLDAAGTLFRPREAVGAIYARYAVAHGLSAFPGLAATLEARFRAGFAAMPAPAYRPGAPAHNAAVDRAWWGQLVRRVMADLGPLEFDAFFDAVYAAFADPALWCTYPETLAVLTRLQTAGVPTAIVSNFDARLLPICRGLGLESRVGAIVYSAGVGVAKPDPAIFRHALERLGAVADATLHVGDSFREDVQGAQAAGLHALHLQRAGADAGLAADSGIIHDLAGLQRFVLR